MHLKKIVVVFLMVLILGSLEGCGRQYAKGGYINPNEIILRSDKFVEADLQLISERLSKSLVADEILASGNKPMVMMSLLTNSTDEHIDMKSLSDKIRTQLFRSKKLSFLNETLRPKVKEEIEHNESGWVEPATAKKRGHQMGADYLISGEITSIKQPVGRQEIIYYKVTLEMTDLGTNVIAWTDEVELKKHFRKRFTGF